MAKKSPLILIFLALGLLFVSFIDICALTLPQCGGWGAINPLCWFAVSGCLSTWFLMSWVLRIVAIILFIVAVRILLRRK